MNFITTTELRTKTSEVVNLLLSGESVQILHRSRVIGKISPEDKSKTLTAKDIKEMKTLLKDIKPKRLIPRNQREEIYRKHLLQKYGTNISRH